MHLESPKTNVQKSQQKVFEFLTKVENYEQIMPESIQKFEVTGADSFIFQLKGMPQIRLKMDEKQPYYKAVLASTSDKFPFTLTAHIEKITDTSSEVQLVFDGEFNSMMAMMIKSPLNKFITTLSENIGKL